MKEQKKRAFGMAYPPRPADQTHWGEHPHDIPDCETRLRFEMLLTNVSARLAAAGVEQIDQEINAALQAVCTSLGLDLSAVWHWATETPGPMVMTHLFRAMDGPPVPDRMVATEYFPWGLTQVMAGRVVALSSVEEAPPEAAQDMEVWRQFGIKTCLTIPLANSKDGIFGAVSFNDVQTERRWAEPLVSRLNLISQIIASALVRKRWEQSLRLNEARLRLATSSAEAGMWSLDVDTGRFWVTDKARQLFRFGEREEITFDLFLESVHPDDRDLIRQSVEAATRDRKEIRLEYRVHLPDGQMRWMASQGRFENLKWGEANSVVLGLTRDVTERKENEIRLLKSLAELKELRDKLYHENTYLRNQVDLKPKPERIIGECEPIRHMLAAAESVGPTDTAVLITGETGTGKELLALAIHDLSPRKGRAMVTVNCAALPAPLIESELFGREKGAYTGAMTKQIGRFEQAHRSTIMLDEIGDLPLDLQAKLLRVLEDGTFQRLGSTGDVKVDMRVIAATNRDLAGMVAEGRFREDLFHRLNVFHIEVPPLRDRSDDIPLLVWSFVQEFNLKIGRTISSIPKPLMQKIREYPWPGNVRELRNIIERAMILSSGQVLALELPQTRKKGRPISGTLEEIERRYILDVLVKVHWRISGEGGAAEILGLVPTTLHSRMKKLGISRPR